MRQNIVGSPTSPSRSSKRPLPLGEGWGEGLATTETVPSPFFSLRFAPSPWPSPRGRGNKKSAYRHSFGALHGGGLTAERGHVSFFHCFSDLSKPGRDR